jgi:hypothetical protein
MARRRCAALVIAATLASATTVAAPRAARAGCTRVATGEACPSPWLDQGATLTLTFDPADTLGTPTDPTATAAAPRRRDHRLASAAALGGLYLGFSTWAYFAWYRNQPSLGNFEWGLDGYFGRNTYAGGADKVGHAWANLVLARASSGVLRWGGWDRTTAAILGSSLAWSLFLFVEVRDGYYYRFSPGDAVFNTAGALLAAAFEIHPRLDELFDFRVAYAPSPEYLGLWRGEYHGSKKGNSLNIAEDYSGQTYVAALHLGALPWPASTPRAARTALDHLDLAVAFETRRYKPDAVPGTVPTQELYLGIALNLQHVLDRTTRGRPRTIGRAIVEHLVPPYTTLPVVSSMRSSTGPAPQQ